MELLLQPRLRLSDRALVAMQATGARARLGLHQHRLLPPGKEMRDIARDAGLLRQACRIAQAGRGSAAPTLSLRITEAQVASGLLTRLIGEALGECDLPPDRMELEFCENSLLGDETEMLYTLAALRDLGVGLVLGGFGAGVSSLTLLRRRSIAGLLSGLKLDRLLLSEQGDAACDDEFLCGLTATAHALGLLVIAEGIDCQRDFERLRDAGCDQGLGSWLGEPQPAIAPDWAGWFAQAGPEIASAC